MGIAATVKILSACCLAPLLAVACAAASTEPAPEHDRRYREWVQEMRQAPRGPFARIRWFCKDGSVLAPEPYACKSRGGGVQHGEWSDRARELRDAGYLIANVLADLDARALLARAEHPNVLAQIAVEQFLIAIDDGWILHKARTYRGAFQEEDERRAARELLLELLADDRRLTRDFTLIRTLARLLPHGAPSQSANDVRQRSAALSELDPGFVELRNKIHARPAPGDAIAVRAYAAQTADAALRARLESLAADVDKLFARTDPALRLRELSRRAGADSALAAVASSAAQRTASAESAEARFDALADALAALRGAIARTASARLRLDTLDLGLELEAELFATASRLRDHAARSSRATRVRLLGSAASALYGAGLISSRQRDALRTTVEALSSNPLPLDRYKRELDYLGRVPGWGAQRLRFHFATGIQTLARIEPKAGRFVEDQLRGSPLLFFTEVLDPMLRDANRLAGVRHQLFGEDVGAGLRALNPGLARGELRAAPGPDEAYRADAIYVLPETLADLPPVAGIVTAGEGNPLSHVQLLARNLGIPNVGTDPALLDRIRSMQGRRVVLAVSAAGAVRLALDETTTLEASRDSEGLELRFRPDLDKLDLSRREPIRLSTLRASDSGRTVGPKAAKLGELKHHFPDAVADGVAIPFGVFRAIVDRPHLADGRSTFDWMTTEYRRLESMAERSAERAEATDRFRSQLQSLIESATLDPEFVSRLRREMTAVFGRDGEYGVFVRSDTNVEDLPGFTGAGLNLTVANVVGVEAVLSAIPRVWASPFTARAFAWRQAHMELPEHVYPAVLLLRSVPVDKSGVMVTRDVDSGAEGWLSVAVNEGVGGAVDGQAAESLRIDLHTEQVRLLAEATAPMRVQLDPAGGIERVPASGSERVLLADEIAQLIELARILPRRFPALLDASGRPAPADVEFGFLAGELKLFQIRPFLESDRARLNEALIALDALAPKLDTVSVNMNEEPR